MPNSLASFPAPGIYEGRIRHRRFSPVAHEFEYPLFLAFLDIDHLAEQLAISPLTGYEKSRLLGYRERDHFGDSSLPLRERVEMDAKANGIELPGGPIYLLTHLRYLGYCFNPISLYYCYDEAGQLGPILAEVNSTFGESHNYWLNGLRVDQVQKRLHVSPFNTMDNHYDFRLNAPGPSLSAHIVSSQGGAAFFDATLTLQHRPWTKSNVHRAIVQFPLMTLQVIAAIHWEALKLFSKRMPFVPHPGKVASR